MTNDIRYPDVSVITVMRDEWDLVERLGKSLSWCEDWHLVVTDDQPDQPDASAAFKELWGDRLSIHRHPLRLGDSFDAARGEALTHCRKPWVLILDTDERVPDSTLTVITEAVENASSSVGGFWFARQNYVLGHPLRSRAYWPDSQLRLVRTEAVKFPDGIHRKYDVEGRAEFLPETPEAAIHHFNFRSNDQFLDKIRTYSTIEMRTGHSEPLAPSAAIVPALKFLTSALFKMGGLRDGDAGIHLTICWAFYRYMSHVKGWERDNTPWDFPPEYDQP